MNDFYTKLNYKIPNYKWEDSGTTVNTEYHNYPKLTYFYMSEESSNLFCSCLPEALFNQGYYEIKLFIIEGKGVVHPHTDYDIKCAINFYFEPNNSLTFWFNIKDESQLNRNDENRSITYDPSNLELTDMFKAKKNDIYLLNNSKVHSVVHSSDSARKIIQLQWYETDYFNIRHILLNDFGKN